jgi:hypothetical protein
MSFLTIRALGPSYEFGDEPAELSPLRLRRTDLWIMA